MPDILDLLKIDRQFESSVNLLIDKGNMKKVEGYIPLASSTAVLRRYLSNVVNNTPEKSTMLIGPYGKGKSHLLLVLSAILEKLGSIDAYRAVMEADHEAGELIERWFKQDKKMLTVVLSNTGESLNQTFMLALYEALKTAGLEGIMPDTYFEEAVKAIDNWKVNFPDTYKGFKESLAGMNLDAEYFIRRLNRFDERYLEKFKEIYPVLTSGSAFNPMINMSVVSIYMEMNRLLCEKYGYAGMLVVFDEFSKYVEGNTKENVSVNMKIIQDFCELANHSSEYPVHAVFVAHKSIREYRDVIPEKIIQGFKGIEGRIKEILFVSSEKNNYGLISYAVKKHDNIFDTVTGLKKYIKYQKESRNLPCFSGVFMPDEFESAVIKGCYPVNPAASYILLRISEKIGQNERTLFTYMTKDEQGSMLRQLKGRTVGEEINGGDIYDYFENLFKDNGILPLIHNEWLKADYALAKAESAAQKVVIKSLALILMVNRPEELPAGRNSLMYASGLTEEAFAEAIKALTDSQLIVYRGRTKEYSFKNNIGIDLFKEVKNEAGSSFAKIELIKELKNIIELRYLFPRKYNVDFTMTRFFEYAFINTKSFLAIERAGILFNKSVSDGRIIVLMDGCNLEKEKICRKLKEWGDPRIMAVRPYESFDKEQSVKYLLAVRKLLSDENFTENNKALIQELKLYEEDLLFEINTAVSRMASPVLGGCSLITIDGCYKEAVTNRQFNKILSDTCKLSYRNAPRINNEQINRRNLTSQIKKARGKIIKGILAQESFRQYDNGKSPEAAIFRAVFYGTGLLGKLTRTDAGTAEVLKEIKAFIESCSGEKKCFAELYDKLEGLGFGVRRGVIPIFLAFSFAGLQDMPFVYFSSREVILDDECLGRINEKPEGYYLMVEESSAKKNEYLKSLEEIFAGSSTRTNMMAGERLAVISDAVKRWYRGLAHYTMKVSETEWQVYSGADLDFTYREFDGIRKIFKKQELNPREIIFDRLPAVFGGESICDEKAVLKLMKIKQYMEQFTDRVKVKAAYCVSRLFDSNGGNLCVVLKNWYAGLSDRAVNGTYSLRQQEILKVISGISGCDEIEAIELLAKASTGIYIEDWSEVSLNTCIKTMEQFYRTVSETSEASDDGENALIMREAGIDRVCYYSKVEESSTGIFLKNAIEEVMNEFGEGIDESEKISVLVELLKGITGK